MTGQKAAKTCWISLLTQTERPCIYRRCKANIVVPIKIKGVEGKRNFCVIELWGYKTYFDMADQLMASLGPAEEPEEEETEDQDGDSK